MFCIVSLFPSVGHMVQELYACKPRNPHLNEKFTLVSIFLVVACVIYKAIIALSISSLYVFPLVIILSYINFKIYLVLKSLFEMSVPYWKQTQEPEYFDWKCIICNHIAQSPLKLENQFIVKEGPYKDKW